MTTITRIILLVALVPLAAAAASIASLLALAPELPAELAVHWGTTGVDRVDGLGSFIGLIAALVPAFTVVMLVAAILALRGGTTRSYLRFLVGASVWFGVSISTGVLGAVLAQRDVTEPLEVPVSAALVPLVLTTLAGLVLAVLVAGMVPAVVERPRDAAAAAAGFPLSPTESVHWSTTVHSPPSVLGVLGVVLVVVVGALLVSGVPWWSSIIVLVVLLALTSMLGWHVVIDRRGLRATGLLGYPRIIVPAASVVSASVVDVDPLREFGGWGMRLDSAGRFGIIVRSGPAIQVDRASSRPLVLTVPDAAAGASTLASVAGSARSR